MRSCFNFIKGQFGNKPLIGAEIGVKGGDNATDILKTLNITKLYLVDSWQGEFGRFFKIAKNRFKNNKKVVIFKDSSLEASKKITESLDFVYIDADHSYEAMKRDIKVWSEKVKTGGFVCGHDYTERWPSIRKAVLEYCSERKICYLVQSDGRRVIDGDFYCNWWFQKGKCGSSVDQGSYTAKIR